jgi:hypothetical protein
MLANIKFEFRMVVRRPKGRTRIVYENKELRKIRSTKYEVTNGGQNCA